MKHWIESQVKYKKENGADSKTIAETYLVEAESFSEAEAKTTEMVSPNISTDFSVSAVKKSNITEIFEAEDDDADIYFRLKYELTMFDEKSNSEKKKAVYGLVRAYDVKAALNIFEEKMKRSVSDYEVLSIAITPILDIIG